MGSKYYSRNAIEYGRFYRIWVESGSRCNNPKRNNYLHYGGRGIKRTWDKFEDFKRDMHQSYIEHVAQFGEKNTTLDRIDNEGNYEKSNCRWATITEQRRNTRKTRWVTYKGETKSLAEWSSTLAISYTTLHSRLTRYGLSIEEAFERVVPVKKPL